MIYLIILKELKILIIYIIHVIYILYGTYLFYVKNIRIRRLFKKSNIRFENMVFFENDIRNINEVKTLGVQCFCVTEEISLKLICSTLNPKKKGKDTVIIYPK